MAAKQVKMAAKQVKKAVKEVKQGKKNGKGTAQPAAKGIDTEEREQERVGGERNKEDQGESGM